MESVGFRHGRSPSSDRFLDVFSPPKSGASIGVDSPLTGYELNEEEIFWTGDFAEPKGRSTSPSGNQSSRSQSFRQKEKFGILAALQEDSRRLNRPVINRKPSISSPSSRLLLPAIPKPPQERDCYSQSAPSRKFIQSAPMKVPVIPRKVMKSKFAEMDSDDAEEEEEMLPPHEIVARGSTKSPYATFSVLEGAGRTLKGRDLRQVRNAVFRQTGFLD